MVRGNGINARLYIGQIPQEQLRNSRETTPLLPAELPLSVGWLDD